MSVHPNFRSILGQRFGQLVIIEEINSLTCIARCDCGQTKKFFRSNLKTGKTSKCHPTPVNHQRRKALHVWSAMKGRCTNPSHPLYQRYSRPWGHILVCDRWLESLDNFIENMGYPPDGFTLERIDNEGHYTPENCRWATQQEQLLNTRRNKHLTFQGKTQTVIEWARELGINHSTLYKRLNRSSWSVERALSTI